MSESERKHYLHGQDATARATLVFSAKEALYKAVFPTLRCWVDFTDVVVEYIDDVSGQLRLRPLPGTELDRKLRKPVNASWRLHEGKVHVQLLLHEDDLCELANRVAVHESS